MADFLSRPLAVRFRYCGKPRTRTRRSNSRSDSRRARTREHIGAESKRAQPASTFVHPQMVSTSTDAPRLYGAFPLLLGEISHERGWLTLAGAGALLVYLRVTGSRTDQQIKTMSADDMRNIVIVEANFRTGRSIRDLQAMSNLAVVRSVIKNPNLLP